MANEVVSEVRLASKDQYCRIGQCTHKTRAEKEKAHGTPSAFEDAVWRAQGDGFCNADEAIAAIDRYRTEFYGAPT